MAKLKTCKVCNVEFMPRTPLQSVCDLKCALVQSRTKQKKVRDKAQRAETKIRRNALKTKSDWLKEAQVEFNKWIRLRDSHEPCISCQRHHEGQYHAGHYLTVGGFPELRFNEDNCAKQCSACNNHLSGNIAAYRIHLIKRIGQAAVDRLEGPHSPMQYTIEQIQDIKATYRAKARAHDQAQ
jgi:hypothetical protein